MINGKNSNFDFWIGEDDILYSEFHEKSNVDLIMVKLLINTRHEVSNGEKQYWCNDIKHVQSYNKEARDYANIHGQDYLYGCAVVVNSHITKFLFNAFLMIKKPHVPFKAFNDKASAVAWLHELKAEIESKKQTKSL